MSGITTRAVRVVLWGSVGIAVLLAGALALALPALEQRPHLAAAWLSKQLGHEVRLGAFAITWRGGAPAIQLHELRLGTPGSGALALTNAELRIDPGASLRARALRPAQVTIRGARIQIELLADGTLQLAGLSEGPVVDAGEVLALLLGALPGQARLALEDATVTLHGFAHGEHAAAAITLTPVSVQLGPDARGVRLSGVLTLPEAPSAPVRFTLRWSERGANPLDSAEITLSTADLPLAALPRTWWRAPLLGQLGLDLDGTLAAGRIEVLRGTLRLQQARLEYAPQVDALQSLIEFVRDGQDGWRATLLRLQARTGSDLSMPVSVVLRREDTPAGRHLLSIDHAPMAGLLGLLPLLDLPVMVSERAGALLQPEGRVEDVEVDLGADLTQPRVQRVSMTLRDARAGDAEAGPFIGPADVRLAVTSHGGQIELLPSPVGLHGAHRRRAPVRVEVGGSVRWTPIEGALELHTSGLHFADGDVRLRLEGHARVPHGDDPVWVNGRLAGSSLDAAAMKRYLELDLLPRALGEWLGSAIGSGRVRTLSASLDGAPANQAEFAHMLRMQASFEQVAVDYAQGWPAIAQLSGELELANGSLALRIDGGEVSGASIASASGSIADVAAAQPLLQLRGQINGSTEHGTAFLARTPIAPRFAGLFEQLDAKGQAALDLTLGIALHEADTTVRGVITLTGNTVRVPVLRSALSQVSGSLAFDDAGLDSGTLRAIYLDKRIAARLEGIGAQRQRTQLSIEGATDPQGLLRHLYDVGAVDRDDAAALPLLSRLSGETRWRVLLDIPHQQRIAQDGIGLEVSSELSGMALDLPAPMGKRADESRTLSVRTRLAKDGPRTFTLSYGEGARALLQMTPLPGGGHQLSRGALRFGDAPAQLPETEGLSVSGEVPLLSVDDWVALIAEATAGAGARPQPMDRVGTLSIHARRLVAMGAGFDDVRLTATRDGSGIWSMRVRGADLDGEIAIPVPIASAPIEAMFEHLYVRPASATASPGRAATAALTPQDLPPARLAVKHLRYGEIDLGSARLSLTRHRDGVEIRDLHARSEHMELSGSGRWTNSGAGTRSTLDLAIHSNDFGNLTQALGYADNGIRGGVADIALDTQWDGSPFDFALDRVRGEVRFRATGGRLLEVEPGATGRMFGLLNVTILPRRLLRLDFSDLFQEGVRYERIEGAFRLDAGNAHTEGVRMHTDTARVDLVGRVGLVHEDYDQIMTVTPKLSASLPLVPIWLAEKFLNRKLIDNAFAYRYIITGSWAEPKVERERVQAPPSETQ